MTFVSLFLGCAALIVFGIGLAPLGAALAALAIGAALDARSSRS